MKLYNEIYLLFLSSQQENGKLIEINNGIFFKPDFSFNSLA